MDALAETLWHEFAIETEEHLQAVEPMLARPDPQQSSAADIAQLFRSFHSVKGLARAMDMLGMEGVAHHAENLLGLVRDGSVALTPDLADLLLQSVDALKGMRDVVAEQRRDVPPDRDLIARLAAAFAQAGGGGGDNAAAPPSVPGNDVPLHEDPEMLEIFVEIVKTRGPELCTALAADADQRALAVDAAEMLAHAAEVMNFDALAERFGGLLEALQALPPAEQGGGPARQDLLSRLGDIRLQIELVGEITGQDAGSAAFSAALAERIGGERHDLAVAIAALHRRLRDDVSAGERLAAEADAAELARLARTLHGIAATLALTHTATIALLIEDLYGRIATGDVEASPTLLGAADAVFSQLAERAKPGGIEDFDADEAAGLTARLRTPLASTAQRALQGEGDGRLVAGLAIPPELLAVLSDENFADLARGIAEDGLLPYEILVHFEADHETAGRLTGWLAQEARLITNRTVITGGESWFEFLALSPLEPGALAAALLALDPGRQCVKRVRRLTAGGGEVVVAPPAATGAPVDPGGDAAPTGRPSAAANLIRVRGETLDAFLDELGEMRVLVGGLSHLIRGAGATALPARARAFAGHLPRALRNEFLAALEDFRDRDHRLLQTEELISGLLSRLHQGALDLRVVPVDVVFNRLPRLVRDLAQQHGKSVELVLEGRDVRIDKSMVELLADPLIHMVRNALDHGIEPPEERLAAGKPERASLTVGATQHATEIRIAIADDGRGLDPEAIRAKAAARGLISPAQAGALADADAFQLIFAAGLSTAPVVTETSGRGVGMDIVLAMVRRLNGDIAIRSERGRGTAFTLMLPASAALQTALIVRVGDQRLAIPERHVLAVAEIAADAIRLVGDHRSIMHRRAVLPLYDLGRLLGMPGGTAGAIAAGERMSESVVIASNGRQMIGLEVDAIERRQELFLKDLDPRLARFPGVGGASVLGDGRVVLVLDGEALIQLAARGIDRSRDAVHGLAS
ncbi:MAG TPA: chemotaxis protein CheW [Stellaceae bacterium]|nr:chemotaxis protein CheW [Stellaceae bacterium]